MWRRVHNRNCDRGSKPVRRLRAARTSAPGPSRGLGALPPRRDARRQTAADDEPGLSRGDVCFIVGACAGGHFALPWHAGPGLCAVDHIAERGVAVDHRKMSGGGVNSRRAFSTARPTEFSNAPWCWRAAWQISLGLASPRQGGWRRSERGGHHGRTSGRRRYCRRRSRRRHRSSRRRLARQHDHARTDLHS
jgi:hypothetical protein